MKYTILIYFPQPIKLIFVLLVSYYYIIRMYNILLSPPPPTGPSLAASGDIGRCGLGVDLHRLQCGLGGTPGKPGSYEP